jgi:tetratricopeptide (TPR) repeat protein
LADYIYLERPVQTCYLADVKRVKIIPTAVLLLSAMLLLASCESAPEEIPDDLSKAQMFQRAQEEVDRGNYESAVRYYEEFILRNPDDPGSITEAEYELAFIAYKQDDYDRAEERFTDLVNKYDGENGSSLPEWPRILSLRLLEIIEERRLADEEPLIRTNLNSDAPEE